MTSLVALSSRQDRCEHLCWVGVSSGSAVWTKKLHFVVVVVPVASVSAVSSFSVYSNPEVPAIVQSQDIIDVHASPAVTPSVSNVLSLSLSVEVVVALSVSAGVAH